MKRVFSDTGGEGVNVGTGSAKGFGSGIQVWTEGP